MNLESVGGVCQLNGTDKNQTTKNKNKNQRSHQEALRGRMFFFVEFCMNFNHLLIIHTRFISVIIFLFAHHSTVLSSAAVHICIAPRSPIVERT